jgi:hypothetical protein
MNTVPKRVNEIVEIYKNAYRIFGNDFGQVRIVYGRREVSEAKAPPVTGISDSNSATTLQIQLVRLFQDSNVVTEHSPAHVSVENWLETIKKPLVIIGGPTKNAYARHFQKYLEDLVLKGKLESHFYLKQTKRGDDNKGWEVHQYTRSKNSSTTSGEVNALPPPTDLLKLTDEERDRFFYIDTGFVIKVWQEQNNVPIFWFAGRTSVATAGAVRLLVCRAVQQQIQRTYDTGNFSFLIGARGSGQRDVVHSAWIENPTKDSPRHNRNWMVVNRYDQNEIGDYPPLEQIMKETISFRSVPSGAHLGLSLGASSSPEVGPKRSKTMIVDYPVVSTHTGRPFAFQVVFPEDGNISKCADDTRDATVQHLKTLLHHLEPQKSLLLDGTWRLLLPVHAQTLGVKALLNFLDDDRNWFPRHRYIFEIVDRDISTGKDDTISAFARAAEARGIGIAVSVKNYKDLAQYQDDSFQYMKIKWQSRLIIPRKDMFWTFVQDVARNCKENAKYMILEGMDTPGLVDEASNYHVPLIMGWPSKHHVMQRQKSLFSVFL